MGTILNSETLGLPTQKFSRDVVTDVKDMGCANLKLLISKQKQILSDKRIKFPDNGKKLKQSIKRAEEELEKRLSNEADFVKELDGLSIKSSHLPVTGKRQFVPNAIAKAVPLKEIQFLSFDDQKKALDACPVRMGDTYSGNEQMGTYREVNKDLDSDDDAKSSDEEKLDSDDDYT